MDDPDEAIPCASLSNLYTHTHTSTPPDSISFRSIAVLAEAKRSPCAPASRRCAFGWWLA